MAKHKDHVSKGNGTDTLDGKKNMTSNSGKSVLKKKQSIVVSYLSTAMDGSGHSFGISADGSVYSWGRGNSFGQLGRTGKARDPKKIDMDFPCGVSKVYTGGLKESGHSAVLDSQKQYLWLCGSDRWQQLGLGSSHSGAAGYTWKDGRIWQERFQRNDHLYAIMSSQSSSSSDRMDKHPSLIRDVALGGDHTVVLSTNQKDVFTFGKGGECQLGLTSKPFVSTPVKSTVLSSDKNTSQKISAVCAIQHCSLTLDENGNIIQKAE